MRISLLARLMGQYNNNDNYNGSVLFCSLASVGVCRLSSSSVVVCNAVGGQAGRPPGALAVGRPTRHGGPVQLRPVSATPVRLVMFLQRQSGERMQYMLDWLIQRLIKQLNQRSSKCLIWSNWIDSSIALNRGHGSTVGPATVSISRLINRLVQPSDRVKWLCTRVIRLTTAARPIRLNLSRCGSRYFLSEGDMCSWLIIHSDGTRVRSVFIDVDCLSIFPDDISKTMQL